MTDRLEEMRAAVARLNEAADAYYNGRGELMTDFEWDALFDRVKAWEAETGVVLPDSPTHRVSADDVAGKKEAHEQAALSLAKTKSVAEVAKWAQGRPLWLSWKLDGLTLVVTYDDGRLTKVVTRGDGHTGTNITHLADGIAGLPRKIAARGHWVIRGEAVISYADFNAYLTASQETYANPRNLASGSLALKDTPEMKAVDELKRRRLRWIPFSLVQGDETFDSWGAQMAWLEQVGLACVEREQIREPSVEALQAVIDRWTVRVTSGENPYPVDGLVVVYDDTAYAKTGSVTGHHATRAGLAFKWQDETAETELERIEWSCAVASISPVAVFKPVPLEGTSVRRASLCNISECERLGIGGPGTKLTVIKANKISPKVVAVTNKVGVLDVPVLCPVCGAPTAVETALSGTKTLRCTNESCAARTLRKFMRFVSKEGMDIDGLAGETLAKFVNRGWIRSVADIYRLGRHRDEISRMEGFGEKSAANLVQAIEKARTRDAVHFLVALSIPLCGGDVAKRLLGAAGDVRTLFIRAWEAQDEELFASVDGLGAQRSAAFIQWCRELENRAVVEDLLTQVTLTMPAMPRTGGTCAGLTFVVTGDVFRFPNRNALKAMIEEQGGHVTGSVSKSTDFLINNDVTSSSGKNKKARELGIPVLSEEDFLARFSPSSSPDESRGQNASSEATSPDESCGQNESSEATSPDESRGQNASSEATFSEDKRLSPKTIIESTVLKNSPKDDFYSDLPLFNQSS